MSNYSSICSYESESAVLHFRIVHLTEEDNEEPVITKASMKIALRNTVLDLRRFLARQAETGTESIKLFFKNIALKDHLTFYDSGIGLEATVTVYIEKTKKRRKNNDSMSLQANKEYKIKDAKSTGSKRRRSEDDMSIASKRTKYDDNMSVSTMATVDPKVVKEKRFHNITKAKNLFRGWAKFCTLASGTLIGGKEQNEDAVFTFQSHNGSVSAVGVFDGHGQPTFASVCSLISRKLTKAWFMQFEADMPQWTPEMWKKKFENLFTKLHQFVRDQFEKMEQNIRQINGTLNGESVVDKKGVVRTSHGAPIHGGTTASICVVIRKPDGEQYLVTAYVGDSDVIIARKGTTVNFELVTEGHRALNRQEYLRIKELPDEQYPVKLNLVYDVQGVKDPRLLPKVYTKTGEKNDQIASNPRLYGLYSSNIRKEPACYAVTPESVRTDRVRLANTRAIGDYYAEQYGVSHIPEVTVEHIPTDQSFFIIAGSDGVWDTWDYHQVAQWLSNVTRENNLQDIHLTDFLHATRSRAHKVYGTMSVVDDSSLCVIHAPGQSRR